MARVAAPAAPVADPAVPSKVNLAEDASDQTAPVEPPRSGPELGLKLAPDTPELAIGMKQQQQQQQRAEKDDDGSPKSPLHRTPPRLVRKRKAAQLAKERVAGQLASESAAEKKHHGGSANKKTSLALKAPFVDNTNTRNNNNNNESPKSGTNNSSSSTFLIDGSQQQQGNQENPRQQQQQRGGGDGAKAVRRLDVQDPGSETETDHEDFDGTTRRRPQIRQQRSARAPRQPQPRGGSSEPAAEAVDHQENEDDDDDDFSTADSDNDWEYEGARLSAKLLATYQLLRRKKSPKSELSKNWVALLTAVERELIGNSLRFRHLKAMGAKPQKVEAGGDGMEKYGNHVGAGGATSEYGGCGAYGPGGYEGSMGGSPHKQGRRSDASDASNKVKRDQGQGYQGMTEEAGGGCAACEHPFLVKKVAGICCHHCQRGKELVRCSRSGCRLHYCTECLKRCYPGLTIEECRDKCPRCMGICNCKYALRMDKRCNKVPRHVGQPPWYDDETRQRHGEYNRVKVEEGLAMVSLPEERKALAEKFPGSLSNFWEDGGARAKAAAQTCGGICKVTRQELTLEVFQDKWGKGSPFVVEGVVGRMGWTPHLMKRAATEKRKGEYQCNVVNSLQDGSKVVIFVSIEAFFNGFVGDNYFEGNPIYSLKSWPTPVEWQTKLKRLLMDFRDCLPVKEYLSEGALNLLSLELPEAHIGYRRVETPRVTTTEDFCFLCVHSSHRWSREDREVAAVWTIWDRDQNGGGPHTVEQREKDLVIIPAGCTWSRTNLGSCIIIAQRFHSPESFRFFGLEDKVKVLENLNF